MPIQIWGANIASVASTVAMRVLVGPLCDKVCNSVLLQSRFADLHTIHELLDENVHHTLRLIPTHARIRKQFGPRILQCMMMIWGGCMVLIAAVAVKDAASLTIMRFLIGIVGATFVPTQ